MKKIFKFVLCIVLICAIIETIDVWKDKQFLQNTLIRLHIVGNLDSVEDQQIKLQIKDAVVDYLKPIIDRFPTKKEAMDYIHENLPALETFSNGILDALGVNDREKVTLQPQSFGGN